MEQEFSLKELYEVKIKTTYEKRVGNRVYQPGETLLYFDKIQNANFQENKVRVSANGGWDNRARIVWQTTKEVHLNFTQGIFSKFQWAMLSNSKILLPESEEDILVSQRETLESGEEKTITLKHLPATNIFVYDSNGAAVTYTVDETDSSGLTWIMPKKWETYTIDYDWNYGGGNTIMKVGDELVAGWLALEGKTRTKDDISGKVRTAIITIPRMKLVSALSMRLGEKATPVAANFAAIGYPVGWKGSTTAMNITFLEDDIDSDM